MQQVIKTSTIITINNGLLTIFNATQNTPLQKQAYCKIPTTSYLLLLHVCNLSISRQNASIGSLLHLEHLRIIFQLIRLWLGLAMMLGNSPRYSNKKVYKSYLGDKTSFDVVHSLIWCNFWPCINQQPRQYLLGYNMN